MNDNSMPNDIEKIEAEIVEPDEIEVLDPKELEKGHSSLLPAEPKIVALPGSTR